MIPFFISLNISWQQFCHEFQIIPLPGIPEDLNLVFVVPADSLWQWPTASCAWQWQPLAVSSCLLAVILGKLCSSKFGAISSKYYLHMLLSEVTWVLMTNSPVIPCECPGLLKESPAHLPHSADTFFPIYCNIYLTTPSSSFRSGLSLFKEKKSLRHLLHDVMSTFHRIYFYPELSCFLKFILHFARNKNHIHSSCRYYVCIWPLFYCVPSSVLI